MEKERLFHKQHYADFLEGRTYKNFVLGIKFPSPWISAEISRKSVANQLPEVPENPMALSSFFFLC